jgi:hypothetical protein
MIQRYRVPRIRLLNGGLVRILIDSGIWLALCASSLLMAAARSMGVNPGPDLLVVASLGTMGVYGFDRWVIRREAKPWWILPAVLAVGAGATLPLPAIGLLGGVCVLAVVHHWLREVPWFKPLYIALAWLGVVVGLPWVLRGEGPLPSAAVPIALAIVANVLACDAVDREAEAAQIGPRRVWWVARATAGAGVILGWPEPTVAIPAAMLLALLPWPADREWAEWVLDGALLAGGVMANALI